MFKIGDFSTIARVSDVLLRHYDEIGLFKPSHIDPNNGYRYYRIEQLPQLNRILALRDLGMSLEQISTMLHENITVDEIQGMLKLKAAQIEQTIEEERTRLRRVHGRLKQIRQEGCLSEHDVLTKAVETQPFLSLRQNLRSLKDASQYYYLIPEVVLAQDIKGLSYCAALFHQPAFRTENVEWELGFLLEEVFVGTVQLPDQRELRPRYLPAFAEMASVVHVGPWAEMHLGFAALGSWMQVNDYQIAGPSREIYLNLVPPGQDEDFAVEIQIPFSRKQA